MKNSLSKLPVLVFLLFVSFINVYSQEEKKCYTDSIFTISKEEMFLNISQYNLKEGKDSVLVDNNKFRNIYTLNNNFLEIDKSIVDKLIKVEKLLTYNLNGKIKRIYFYNIYQNNSDYFRSTDLFKNLIFDDTGNLIQEIDTDKGYTICWQEAIEICKKLIGKRELKKYNIKDFALRRADLNDRPNDTPLWIVSPIAKNKDGSDYESDYENKYFKDKKGSLAYHIDGLTGKLLRKRVSHTEGGYLTITKDVK